MKESELAYYTIYLNSEDATGYMLSYRERDKSIANRRVLLVAMPYPEIGELPPNPLRQMSPLDRRRAHLLGMHLIKGAMEGKSIIKDIDPIVDIWDLTKSPGDLAKKPTQIAIPRRYLLKQLKSGQFVAGYFTIYAPKRAGGLVEAPPFDTVQLAGDWLCRINGQKTTQLGSPRRSAPLGIFPPPREWREALKKVATERLAKQTVATLRSIEEARQYARSREMKVIQCPS